MINTLPNDYLRNAQNFVFVAESACSVILPNTVERVMIAENPLNFLLGHASELLLKSALAFKGYDEGKLKSFEFRHDLIALKNACELEQITLNSRFVFWIEVIAENHKDFDFRYARSFGGFPDEDHKRLSELIGDRSSSARNELRKHGLVATSPANIDDFIVAIKNQIKIVSSFDTDISKIA